MKGRIFMIPRLVAMLYTILRYLERVDVSIMDGTYSLDYLRDLNTQYYWISLFIVDIVVYILIRS